MEIKKFSIALIVVEILVFWSSETRLKRIAGEKVVLKKNRYAPKTEKNSLNILQNQIPKSQSNK